MSLFRRLFYRRPPDGLVEISANILVFDHCFSTDLFEEDELRPYIGGILKQLLGRYSIDSFMVFNFERDKKDNQIASIFSDYGMSVMGYPRNYEGCPLLTLDMIHHFLWSSESWLSLSQDNFLLIHSEHGGWPVLSFALAALLVYLRRYNDERKALEMVCRQAPEGLSELFSPLDPVPSQLRYLNYVSKRHISPELWPPVDTMLNLNCVIIRMVPNFDGQGGCRPIFRIYGSDPLVPNERTTKVLFSNVKTSDLIEHYTQEECEIIKINVLCPVQGDVVMECTSLDEDCEHEVMMFRAMFSTAFIEDNLLLLARDQIDILWDTEHRFPADFRVEAIFSEMDMARTIRTSELSNEDKESISKVDDVFSHLDWSSTRDHTNTTKAESGQKELCSGHDGFDAIPLEETEVSNITSEQNFLDSRSVQVHHIEPAHDHYSVPKFEVPGPNYQNSQRLKEPDHVSSMRSLPEPEVPGPNYQNSQRLKGASIGKELEVDNTENEPNSKMQSSTFRDAQATGKEPDGLTPTQTCSCQMEPQATLPLARQSSTTMELPTYDVMKAGTVGTRSQPTGLQA